uniref:Uncharacterized protein n=1 Tax=viral metagenome TaxID=1070528 RepID=A0A6M3XYK8_9ZZZZ
MRDFANNYLFRPIVLPELPAASQLRLVPVTLLESLIPAVGAEPRGPEKKLLVRRDDSNGLCAL